MNLLIRIVFIVIILIGFNCNITSTKNAALYGKHSVKELREDIDFTFKKIKKLHPNLYTYISEEELDAKIDSVKKSIVNPMTSEEFFLVLSPLVAEIRQGHTSVYFPFEKNILGNPKNSNREENKVEKHKFECIEDKIIISEVYDLDKSLQFAELLKMDGKNITYYLDKYNNLRTSDGFNSTMLDRRKGSFVLDYYLFEEKKMDKITLTLSLNDSVFDTTFYNLSEYEEYYEGEEYDDNYDTIENKEIKGFNYLTGTFSHDYKYLDSNKEMAFLKIEGFENEKYKEFYDLFFQELDSFDSSTLIIDLRNNFGGNLAETHYLLKYLYNEEFTYVTKTEAKTRIPITKSIWNTEEKGVSLIIKTVISPFLLTVDQFDKTKKNGIIYQETDESKPAEPKKKSFDGKLYILINGNSFSAASIVATHLQGSKRAIIVGEESGGAYNGTVAGLFDLVTLPYSKLEVAYGFEFLKTIYTDTPDGYGVIPDYKITPTIEDRKNGIDTELNWVVERVKNGRKGAGIEEEEEIKKEEK